MIYFQTLITVVVILIVLAIIEMLPFYLGRKHVGKPKETIKKWTIIFSILILPIIPYLYGLKVDSKK